MLKFEQKASALTIEISGDCCHYDEEAQKEKIYASAQILPQINVTAKNLQAWDSTLLALLYELAKIAAQKNYFFWPSR